jgi:hypothetical protein
MKKLSSHSIGFKQFAVLILIAVIGITGGIILRLNRTDGDKVSFDSNVDGLFQSIKSDIDAHLSQDYKVAVEPWYAENTFNSREIHVNDYAYKLSSAALHTVRIQTLYPHNGEGSNFTPSVDTYVVHDRVADVLKKYGYEEGGSVESGLKMTAKTVFTGGDVMCTLTEDRSNYDVVLVCDSPELRGQLAAQGGLFIPQYLAKHPNLSESDLTYGPAIIKSRHPAGVLHPSKTAGYDIAEVLIQEPHGTRLVLYYKKQNGPWTYITDTTDEFGFTCGDMRADPDARKAMYAQVCYERPDQGPRLLDADGRATQ